MALSNDINEISNDINEISKLAGTAVEQLGKLVQNEAQLARAEVSEKVVQAGIGAAYVAGAAALMMPVLVLLLIALAIWLTRMGLSPVTAHLVSAAVGALISAILAWIGVQRLKPENLQPKVTARQVRRDVAAAGELAR
jgi:uncharacterized membrane protein YgcG